MKQYIFLSSAFVHRSPNSFLFFSPFFALLPTFLFFITYDKVFFFSFLFICICSLFWFFLVFRTRHGVVGKGLVRDEALRSVALNQNKKFCLTEDAQSRFQGNCLPTPPLTNRMLNEDAQSRFQGNCLPTPPLTNM